jgi:hypothetical protein
MRISLDYDGTYTEDPVLWDKFIDLLQLRDHEVMVVTFRGDDTPIDHEMKVPVYYTAAHPKREWMEGLGIKIDVWIDDLPELITHGSEWTLEERERWRAAQ